MKNLSRLLLPLLSAVAAPALAQSAGVAVAAPAAADASARFELFLPLRDKAGLKTLLEAQQTEGSPSYRKWLTPAEFARRFGPGADAIATATAALRSAGLNVSKVNARSLTVTGNVGAVNRLLGATLGLRKEPGGAARLVAMSRPVLPAALQAIGAKVIGFSTVQPARPLAAKARTKMQPDNRYGTTGPYWFTDLKQAYDYPAYTSILKNGKRLDGTGVNVAVLMSDLVFDGDVAAVFDHEKFTAVSGNPAPVVSTVLVNGGGVQNGPGSFEASLDVQQVTGGAPGANVTLVSVPDLSNDNIIDGYNYIVNTNQYDIVSSSFGECELFFLPEYNQGVDYTSILDTYEEIFQQGNAQGITFLASSGDGGALQCTTLSYLKGKPGKFVRGVSSPAASRFVTAVGGGNLVTVSSTTSPYDSAYVDENGFADPLDADDPYGTGGYATGGYFGAGGGISTIFTQPTAQFKVRTGSKTHRTLPDIGMEVGGCPLQATPPCGPDRSSAAVAYGIGQGGIYVSAIGTSVSSPEFAGALALYVEKQGKRVGDINPFLYKRGLAQTRAGGVNAPADKQYFHRNIPGFDGLYRDTDPSQNYNYIVGNGTPDVRVLFDMTEFPPAGVPQTATNP